MKSYFLFRCRICCVGRGRRFLSRLGWIRLHLVVGLGRLFLRGIRLHLNRDLLFNLRTFIDYENLDLHRGIGIKGTKILIIINTRFMYLMLFDHAGVADIEDPVGVHAHLHLHLRVAALGVRSHFH